jgi:EAL domain-containing protein (putative c-di-GMP-specific phosphodiesterase class I)
VLVTAILHMAKSLGLASVAEWVETESDLAFVQRHGIDAAQGHLFSPPLPLQAFTQFLSKFHAWPARAAPDQIDGQRPAQGQG